MPRAGAGRTGLAVAVAIGVLRVVGEREIGIARELPVAAAAVELLGFLEPFANQLVVVIVARVQLEQRTQPFALRHAVAGERQLADLVALAFGHRNLQLDEPGLGVLGVLEDLQLGLADVRLDVAAARGNSR